MSYTEYLRRKAAKAPVVLDTRKPTDASMMTQKTRFAANTDFAQAQSRFLGSLRDGKDRSGYPLDLSHSSATFFKNTGRPAAASEFTSWRGGQGVGNDAAYYRGRITQQNCNGCVPSEPVPYTGGQRSANTVQTNASSTTHAKICTENGKAEPHTQGKLGTVFVDNTIRLSSGAPKVVSDTCCYPSANHSIKEIKSTPLHSARPAAPGMVVNVGGIYEHPGTGRKVGGLVPSDHLKYVENHHGNDLGVNRKQPIVKYQIPAGTPAHLKINDPLFGNVKP